MGDGPDGKPIIPYDINPTNTPMVDIVPLLTLNYDTVEKARKKWDYPKTKNSDAVFRFTNSKGERYIGVDKRDELIEAIRSRATTFGVVFVCATKSSLNGQAVGTVIAKEYRPSATIRSSRVYDVVGKENYVGRRRRTATKNRTTTRIVVVSLYASFVPR